MNKIQQSKIFEVYESEGGKKKSLFTINLTPGKKVYGEYLIKQDDKEFREWDAYSSKLAALILKGCPNIGLRKNDVVLYLGSASGTTVSHVSDIIGENGFVFAVDIAPRVVRDLVFVCEDRKNIAPILGDGNKQESFAERVSQVDIVYQDIAQKNQVQIFLKNIDLFLKDKGYALLALKARSIDVAKNPREIFKSVREELENNLTLIDFKLLEPYQKDHCMFVCKK